MALPCWAYGGRLGWSWSLQQVGADRPASDGQLQLGQVPLVHVVVSDQLVRTGKLLLAVGPPTVEWFLTWHEYRKGERTVHYKGSKCII